MRLEYKYLLPKHDLDRLRRAITPFVRPDVFCARQPDKQYTVRSIYYDTAKLDNYIEKIEGVKIRRKVRIRGYNDYAPGDAVVLEIKRKTGARIHKNRAPIDFTQLEDFLISGDVDSYFKASQNGFHGRDDAQKFLYQLRRNQLHREVLVVYEREAFHGRFNDALRISFDKNLRARMRPTLEQLYCSDNLTHAFSRYDILEIKFYTGIPLWLKDVLKQFNLTQSALSKYTICRDIYKRENVLRYKC